jgi:hypothetical protein
MTLSCNNIPCSPISLPRQCRDCLESVALGAGVVAASSREDYGVAPPTEVEQHRLPAPPGMEQRCAAQFFRQIGCDILPAKRARTLYFLVGLKVSMD